MFNENICFYCAGMGYEEILGLMLQLINTPEGDLFEANGVSSSNFYNHLIAYAVEGGHKDIVAKLIASSRVGSYGLAMESAAKAGQLDILETIPNHPSYNVDYAMRLALYNGHLAVGQYLIDRFFFHKYSSEDLEFLTTVAAAAAQGGLDALVRLMFVSGVIDYNAIMIGAAAGGHIEMVREMIKKGADNYDEVLATAAVDGHIEIVKLMLGVGIYKDELKEKDTDLYPAMTIASEEGYIDIVQLMLDHNVEEDACIESASGAAKQGHIDIVKLLLGRPGIIKNKILEQAALGGRLNVVQYIIEEGANDYIRATERAHNGWPHILVYLLKVGLIKKGNVDIGRLKQVHIRPVDIKRVALELNDISRRPASITDIPILKSLLLPQ
jgi:hypothetical protein